MSWKKYILYLAQEHLEFRIPEIRSLLQLLNIPHKLPSIEEEESTPYIHIELPDDECARLLASRSVSIRYIVEQWASASSLAAFHEELKSFLAENATNPWVADNFDVKRSFRITVETFNNTMQHKEKIEKIESLAYLPVLGDVSLSDPDVHWYYMEYYGLDTVNIPEQALRVMFGKWITDGSRSLIRELSLKTRKFIGNTSMDPTLSLYMTNQAQVQQGDLVFDPFVGTGSLLVAAAKHGAFVLGTDIDYLMLHGRSKPTRANSKKVREKDESILANLKQYDCDKSYVDVLVSDFSNPIWHKKIQFDCIITDPPYGIREATEKIEAKLPKKPVPDQIEQHYPSMSPYSLSALYGDLLKFAGNHLRLGGRIVFWLPICNTAFTDAMIPKSSCFTLIANSCQRISSVTSRLLLTYEKIAEPTADAVHEPFEPVDDFRVKFFTSGEESRQERKIKRAELREFGRLEALKRGTYHNPHVKEDKIQANKKRFE